jgi:hypothetical protein
MSAQKLEDFLARLYVDDQARARFLADPSREVSNAGLTASDCAALENIDLIGLELAAESFARKRAAYPPKPLPKWTRWLGRRRF